MDKLWIRPMVKTAAAVAALALALWFIYLARAVLFPFCAAFVLAYLLDPIIDRIESRRINRCAAILLLLMVLFGLFLAVAVFLAPLVMEQVETLGKNLPGYVDHIEKKLAWLIELIPDMDNEDVKARVRQGAQSLGGLPLRALNAVALGLWSGLTGAMGLVVALFNLVVIPVATYYLLKDFDAITAAISARIPPRYRDRAFDIIGKIDSTLSGFFRGQLMVALFMAAVLSLGLFLIGIPMGLFIGIVAGLSNIVPYLPVFVGLAPALLLAYLSFGDWQHIAMVAALFAAAQAVEGFYITPKVLEKAVGLHPVAVMASLLVGGAFFGFIGIVLAVPVAAVLKVVLLEVDEEYLKSKFFLGAQKDHGES